MRNDQLMQGLSLTIETIADEIRKAFWTGTPYRRVKLRLTLSNNSQASCYYRLEVLLPEAIVIGVPNGEAVWNPAEPFHDVQIQLNDYVPSL